MTKRQATITRNTNETQIEVFLDLDCMDDASGTQNIEISTGIGFLDHVCTASLLK
jgi:imidazoleglycerol-phosphate dehydratase